MWIARRYPVLTLALLVLPALAGQGVSHAGEDEVGRTIARATAAEQALEYEQARELWLELIASDQLDPQQRLEANLHAGTVARILDRDVEARSHFVYVLEQQPGYTLPASTAPKVRNFFELIRQELHARGASSAPRPPDAATVSARDASIALEHSGQWLFGVGVAVAGLGLIGAVTGVTAGALSSAAQGRALATEVQVERMDHYRTRDDLALVANIGYAAAAVLLLGGASSAAVGLWLEGE